MRGEDGYCTHEQACILQTVKVQSCSCEGTNFTVSPGKPVILITINGHYDLHQPRYVCVSCQQQWTPALKDLLRSGYWPATVNTSTLYTLDLLSSFQELKVISLGFSRQAFAKLLEHRTKQNHKKCNSVFQSGHISGDALQRSFLEFSYASFEEDQLCCGEPFTCPACMPEMLAVAADGNRKLYHFRQSGSSDDPGHQSPFFEGLFVAKDGAVSEFVDTVRRSTQGRGTCGDSQWTAAWETSRRASKLDEEGMEVAVCCHGFLLKALNMYRGEIFAYPLFLQKELMPAKAQFFAMDVACKYWPYLEKAASVLPALQELTKMKPFLSVMHAHAPATKCEVGGQKYNGLVRQASATNIDAAMVEHSLTGESTVSPIWPWEVHGSANITIKKQLHDQVMLTMRLQEEKNVLVLEMAQHCTWLQNLAVVLKNTVAEEGGNFTVT
ncbi:hypothetical protein N1851_005188 [Merluccius polli]|uniref:CxC3 like cysteine cluster domain-containing protein n=1 Tax=Merluccius polli TaxID=89951 RepID=A0AA47P6S8_MERPO|nr:hypothetical protein N1851_005188 [Merluccius polli]